MKHPTKAQVQVVIDNLKKAAEMADGNCPVDTSECNVSRNYCGTPHCHAGWYAIATAKHAHSLSNYEDGASKMAKDLGFYSYIQMQKWGRNNREIWGNAFGAAMFSGLEAFGFDDDTNPYETPDGMPNDKYDRLDDLQPIISHWEGVQSRLPE